MVNKKERKHALDQESDQEKMKKKTFFFLDRFLTFLFSFYKFSPLSVLPHGPHRHVFWTVSAELPNFSFDFRIFFYWIVDLWTIMNKKMSILQIYNVYKSTWTGLEREKRKKSEIMVKAGVYILANQKNIPPPPL